MSRLRLYRFWKWWKAIGLPENNEHGADLIRSLGVKGRIGVAWDWSADKEAFDQAPRIEK